MLIAGVVLMLLAWLIPLPGIFFTIGVILAVIGAVLLALSYSGREVGGRRWY